MSSAPRPEPTRRQPDRAARMMSLMPTIDEDLDESTGDTGLQEAEERALRRGLHCLLAQQRAEYRWSPMEYHNDEKLELFSDLYVDVIVID